MHAYALHAQPGQTSHLSSLTCKQHDRQRKLFGNMITVTYHCGHHMPNHSEQVDRLHAAEDLLLVHFTIAIQLPMASSVISSRPSFFTRSSNYCATRFKFLQDILAVLLLSHRQTAFQTLPSHQTSPPSYFVFCPSIKPCQPSHKILAAFGF